MFYNHILLEAYCTKDQNSENEICCKSGTNKINIKCFTPFCTHLSLIPCANEFAITDGDGIAPYWIGFGGDMIKSNNFDLQHNIERWHKICTAKIDEAYELFMHVGE